ncbi:hypothetical protein E4656_03230 [Natronospirillum operosum]|uniref:Zinc finger CGNR domain-containing protein n=1 Tax=Natronospirillum operosum TaxID=2759953 RepID=A0A4Z0WII5_9GAMM|nr:CGNR zinc finger domain-containing protein [Natronospirillum operosum]TGG95451.1 hypothetical protein E4656_03230 [Natronospirillum operosum]
MTVTQNHQLVGGRLCLDFLNTADWQDETLVADHVETLADLSAWSRRAGLHFKPVQHADATTALQRISAFRQDLRALFLKVMTGQGLNQGDANFLNSAFATSQGTNPITVADGALVYQHSDDLCRDLQLPVLFSALDLLTSPDIHRVKRCPGHKCGWLFVDQSRNGARKWCSMETCGNREKARSHYKRTRG